MFDDILWDFPKRTDKEFREIYCDICTDYDECQGRGKLLEVCKKIKVVQKRIKGRN